MHVEGQRARERIQRTDALATKKKADLGDLINLGNVELRRTKPTKMEKWSKTGLDKVVSYALWERGLGTGVPRRITVNETKTRPKKTKKVVWEGKKKEEFIRPLSSKGAKYLARRTREWNEQQESHARRSVA
jgi:hypothetical protein